jgi:hypothetical protein
MTKIGRGLNKYAELHKMENLHSHPKKLGGKAKQVWLGVKLKSEGDEAE